MLTSASARRSAILAKTPGWLAVSIVSTSVSSARTPASPREHERLGRIADHHAHNSVIDCVGRSERVYVNFSVGQRFTHARKRARTICKKDRELGGCFNGELGR